jgi:hypothetical protein
MRADMTKVSRRFDNFANAPMAAINTLQNINSFYFIKKFNFEECGKKVSTNVWQTKDSSSGIFTGFFLGGLFAISHFEQIYSAKFDKYFMVIFVIKEII